MEFQMWWVWGALAVLFIIAEIFTAGFFLVWFGIGAAAAGLCSFLGLAAGWQWAAFAVVSGVLFALSRRFAEKVSGIQPPGIGADRLIGKKGVVIEDIDNLKNVGRVRIDKDEWRADSASGDKIAADKIIEVVKVEGAHVVVKALEEDK